MPYTEALHQMADALEDIRQDGARAVLIYEWERLVAYRDKLKSDLPEKLQTRIDFLEHFLWDEGGQHKIVPPATSV
jgi:hypothetical protein